MISKKNILLVDDSTFCHKIVRSGLKQFNLICVLDTPEAEEVLEEYGQEIALILLDISLPTEKGTMLAKRLAEDKNFSNIPIVFLTSHDKPEDVADALSYGGVDYVKKPFSKIELLCRVEAHLKIRDLHEQLIQEKQVETVQSLVVTLNHTLNNPLTKAVLNTEKLRASIDKDNITDLNTLNAVLFSLDEISININKMSRMMEVNYSEYVEGVNQLDLDEIKINKG
jgi:DNA-binding response OmpR family regulator